MADPDAVSDARGEWIELYNDSNIDTDINGWIIKDADTDYHLIDNSAPLIMQAKSFLVLGRNGEFPLNGGYIPDYVYSGFLLTNSADEIILEDSEVTVSEIDYTTNWPIYAGKSMAFSGSGIINNPSNWWATSNCVFGDGDYGTPGGPNLIPEPATLVLFSIGLLPILFKRRV